MNKSDIKIELPQDVKFILNTLKENGYESFVVGGCVRDSILNRPIHDWDITTNAIPEQVINLFDKTIPTGIKHGTVTVMINNVGYEVTTYRTESKYSDGRHPDEVKFVNSLKEDLSRRDFTINAMAYNEEEGLIDYFGGFNDIKHGVIRCVGNPQDRLKEDYLRVLRGIRFSLQLGFKIHYLTRVWIIEYMKEIPKFTSEERQREEINKILMELSVKNSKHEWFDEFLYIFGLYDLVDISQNNPYHCYDVLIHTLTSMTCVDTLELKLTMLLHDIGKGDCKTTDNNGVEHFYGHAKVSKEIAEKWLDRFKYDNKTKEIVLLLIENHDIEFMPTKKFVKKMLNKFGEENFKKLIKVRKADILAQNPQFTLERLDKVFKVERLLEEVIKDNECFTLKDLAINGNDLKEMGFKGKEIGFYLNYFLNSVINETIKNEREELLKKSKIIYYNLKH